MNIMILVLSVLSFIFFLSVHSDMLFKYVWVFRFSDAMYPLLVGISVGTLNFELKLEMPIERRLTISNAGKSSTNFVNSFNCEDADVIKNTELGNCAQFIFAYESLHGNVTYKDLYYNPRYGIFGFVLLSFP